MAVKKRAGYRNHEPMKNQMARLFGAQSKFANADYLTDAEWRIAFKKVTVELYRYMRQNVDTDPPHRELLESAFLCASHDLDTEDAYIGYIQALTRLCLVLMGDYPDHRKRRGKGKGKGYYGLQMCRSLEYTRSPNQRLWALDASRLLFVEGCDVKVFDELNKFRRQFGYEPTIADFLRWFAAEHPVHYAATF